MKNHCWHEIGEEVDYLNLSRTVVCCNCDLMALRPYKYEYTRLEGHGKYFAPQTLVPQPVECDEECKDE